MNIQPLIKYMNQQVQLTNEEIAILSEFVQYRRFLKGQFLVQQGDVCKQESFVIKGCLKTFFVDQNGDEHVVGFALPNWWAADLGSFISQTPADYNVQCLELTEVIQFSYENLEQLYRKIPKMERFFRIIIQKAYVASQKRVIQNFSMPARERYLLFREQYPEIEQRVPQYMIASYLGITKEFLSKIRNQLQSK